MASEIGRAQTTCSNTRGVEDHVTLENGNGRYLERYTKQGKSPVRETVQRPVGSRVRQDTRNPDGIREDYLLRLNTTM